MFCVSTSYNQLQKYLRHCTIFWLEWPAHDLVLVTPRPPLIKVASNTGPCSKRGGTTLSYNEVHTANRDQTMGKVVT